MMQLGLPMAQRLTFLSSAPVTITRPDFWPKARHVTLDPCATNSSDRSIEEEEERVHERAEDGEVDDEEVAAR